MTYNASGSAQATSHLCNDFARIGVSALNNKLKNQIQIVHFSVFKYISSDVRNAKSIKRILMSLVLY